MKNLFLADQNNADLLIDRFREFIQKNEEKTLKVKEMWGVPTKREAWKNSLITHKLVRTPKIEKHQDFGQGEYLFSIQPQSETDVINIHFCGDLSSFYKAYPKGLDFANNTVHSFIIKEGDEIFFKNEGIVVVPKRKYEMNNKKLSWFLTAC